MIPLEYNICRASSIKFVAVFGESLKFTGRLADTACGVYYGTFFMVE
jgi:hypothetical protein